MSSTFHTVLSALPILKVILCSYRQLCMEWASLRHPSRGECVTQPPPAAAENLGRLYPLLLRVLRRGLGRQIVERSLELFPRVRKAIDRSILGLDRSVDLRLGILSP